MSVYPLQWRHNGRDSVSNHQPYDCLLNDLFKRRSKKTSKLRVTGLCAGNSPDTGEFPAQMTSNAENVSIWWRHHETVLFCWCSYLASWSEWHPPDYRFPIRSSWPGRLWLIFMVVWESDVGASGHGICLGNLWPTIWKKTKSDR